MEAHFDYLSVNEVAAVLGMTDGRVRQLLREGQLEGHRVNDRAWAIHCLEVERFKQQPRKPGRARVGDGVNGGQCEA